MKKYAGTAILCLYLPFAATTPAQERKPTFTTFEAPGAGTEAGQGTGAMSINPEGDVAGWDVDGSGVWHGFVRAPDGTITTFNIKGAGTGSGQGTTPAIINQEGAIDGSYVDEKNVSHGFLRLP